MYNLELDTNKMSLAWHYSQVENNYSVKTKFLISWKYKRMSKQMIKYGWNKDLSFNIIHINSI